MTDMTKITLSAKELELVCNTDWILTKQVIINKVISLFTGILETMQCVTNQYKDQLPQVIFTIDPKISKGENYKGLPYVMLDYPRYFDKEETLAVRMLFWWGNYFSISLQLSGNIKNEAIPNLVTHFLYLQQQEYWLCVGDTPWHHHFEEDNYVPLQKLTSTAFERILAEKDFIKIGKKIELEHWDMAKQFTEQSFKEIMNLLKINCPSDGKVL